MTEEINRFEMYLSYERRVSEKTVESYKTDLQQFCAFLEERYPGVRQGDIAATVIRSWIVDLMQRGLSNNSVNRKISTLKTFYKYMLREGLVETNPMERIQLLKKEQRLPEYAQKDQLMLLFKSDQFEDNFSGWRDKLMLMLLYSTGIRRAELIELRVVDYDKDRAVLRVKGKGNKERFVPVIADLAVTFDIYLDLYKKEFGCFFNSPLFILDNGLYIYPKFVYNVVKKYLKTVTTNKYAGPHSLRHAFATHLSNEGADINALKALLGHSSLAATQVYTHNSIEQLKQTYKQAHPRSEEADKG